MCSTVCQRGTVGVEEWLQNAVDTQVSALLGLTGKKLSCGLSPSVESSRPAGPAGPFVQQLSYVLLYTVRLARIHTVKSVPQQLREDTFFGCVCGCPAVLLCVAEAVSQAVGLFILAVVTHTSRSDDVYAFVRR